MAETATGPGAASVPARGQGGVPDGPRLNLGCGPVQPEGWVNVDGSHRAWFASRLAPIDRLLVRLGLFPPTEYGPQVTVLDLRKRLPWADCTVGCVYSGELWEHFELPDATRLTAECFRVLAPGGVLRLCVPDGVQFWGRYLELVAEASSQPPATRDVKKLREHVQLFFNDICTRKLWLGSMGHKHKWQFDEPQLVDLLRSRGFVDVERRPFRESRIPGIEAIERSDFLIVEGVKPR